MPKDNLTASSFTKDLQYQDNLSKYLLGDNLTIDK